MFADPDRHGFVRAVPATAVADPLRFALIHCDTCSVGNASAAAAEAPAGNVNPDRHPCEHAFVCAA